MNPAPLRVTNLTKTFTQARFFWQSMKPAYTAVHNISFELKEGEILGLLGPNGAGKTTTIQMLLGTMLPTNGQIIYFGKELTQDRSEILSRVAFASTYVRLPGRLTVYENLHFYAELYGLTKPEQQTRIDYFLKRFHLWHLKDRNASGLSAGEMTRALLVKAFLSNPEVVLLDEPTASLDPDIAHEIRNFILEQRKERGVAVVFTSHNMDEVTQTCDRVLILKQGHIIADDTPRALAARISKARVTFMSDQKEAIIRSAQELHLLTICDEQSLTIEIDEHTIADFLSGLARNTITYTQISIDKPTLEDYFLSIAQREKGNSP